MRDVTIILTNEELCIIRAAMAHYRLAGFPMGRSSYGNPISSRDRRAFATYGMNLWEKLAKLKPQELVEEKK